MQQYAEEIKNSLTIALDYATDHPEFDDTFIQSLRAWFDKHGKLTPKQGAALERIVEGFRMREFYEKGCD